MLLFILPVFLISLKPVGFLNDFAGILAQSERDEIENRLREIERETKNEISVLIINSLEGKSIEDFASEIFNEWGIGKKGKDNGVLIVIAMRERTVRIEVGYGLEKYLPDAVCGRIIRNIIAPNFRENNYYKGIKEAIETIHKLTKGESFDIKEKDNLPPFQFRILWYVLCIFFGFVILGLLGVLVESLLIFNFIILSLISGAKNFYELNIFLSMIVPFFFIFILNFLSFYISKKLRRKLKKYYGKKWKRYIPFYLKGGGVFSSTSNFGGGFSGGFGGFGGGASGGGGATGRW